MAIPKLISQETWSAGAWALHCTDLAFLRSDAGTRLEGRSGTPSLRPASSFSTKPRAQTASSDQSLPVRLSDEEQDDTLDAASLKKALNNTRTRLRQAVTEQQHLQVSLKSCQRRLAVATEALPAVPDARNLRSHRRGATPIRRSVTASDAVQFAEYTLAETKRS